MECLLKKRKLELLNEIKEIDGLIKFQEMFDIIPVDVWFSIFKHLDGNLMLFRVSWTCSKWRHTVQKFNMIKATQMINYEFDRLGIDINIKLPHYMYSAKTHKYLMFHLLRNEIVKVTDVSKNYRFTQYIEFEKHNKCYEEVKYIKNFVKIYNIDIEYIFRIHESDIPVGIRSFKAVPNDLKNLIVVFKFRNLEYEHRVVLH